MSSIPKTQAKAPRSRKRRPDLDSVYSINEDGSRNFLHPADVRGRWQRRVQVFWTLLILVYVGLPWIEVAGQPAVRFDLPGRAAYLFGLSFTNQDFYLSFFALSGLGFALFVLTALYGRVWCGFACPQTVFMEGIYRRIERWIEGPRNTRIRRNMGPNDFDKVWRKILKHTLFLGLSYGIAHVFLSYFIPVHELLQVIRSNPAEHKTAFGWSMFFTGLMYFDYAWFREQTCLIICPYGRIQSALIDPDTIIIGYDEKRGEPRSHGVDEGGDCIDCYRCVEVCPTGIDIRNGLQMECIGCTRCIDACDDIMDRIAKPRGLVRYDSERSFEGGEKRSILRPRVFLYLCLGLIGIAVATLSVHQREPFGARALRARGMPYTLEEHRIRNLVNVHLQNKRTEEATLFVRPGESQGLPIEYLVPQPRVHLAAMEDQQVPVFVFADRKAFDQNFGFTLLIEDSLSGRVEELHLTFRGP